MTKLDHHRQHIATVRALYIVSHLMEHLGMSFGHFLRYSCGSLKVLEFFSRFSRPGKSLKTDMVLESP